MVNKEAVVITGASTGIGRDTALHLSKLGYHVFAGVRKEADAQVLADDGRGAVTPLLLDVTDASSVARAAAEVAGTLAGHRLVAVINNAGITVVGPLEYLPVESLRQQLEVNLIGYFAVAQAFLPLLRASKGRIVNIGSMVGRVAIPYGGPYAMSKHALEALTESLRMELKPWGIPVSLIGPGAVATPLWEKSLRNMEASVQALPAAATQLYQPALTKIREYQVSWARSGISPQKVVAAVAHAVRARKPRRRYVVGKDAWQAEFLRLLPTPVKEALLLWQMGL